jgi:hypothetical protein
MLEGTSPDVPKIFGSAGALPSRKTIRYLLLVIRCRFGSAGASPSQTFAVDEGVQPLSNLLSSSDLVRAMMMG